MKIEELKKLIRLSSVLLAQVEADPIGNPGDFQ